MKQIQFSSVALLCLTLCNTMKCSTTGFPVLHYLPEFAQTHVHWVSDTIQPSHSLLFPSPPASIFPRIRVFSSESTLHMRWRHSFQRTPRTDLLRMDWLDLLAVQGTLKSLLQHHSSKASIFQGSAFFTVQLSHPYMATGKTIALTRRTFVAK